MEVRRLKTKIILDGKFEVTSEGEIFRIKNGIKKPATVNFVTRNKYKVINYHVNGKQRHEYVHRLIAEVFISNPENKPQVNHIDGNPHNNMVENLEWVTAKENVHHAIETGLFNPRSFINSRCKNCNAITFSEDNVCPKCKKSEEEAITKEFRNKILQKMIDGDRTTQKQSKVLKELCENFSYQGVALKIGTSKQDVEQKLKTAMKRCGVEKVNYTLKEIEQAEFKEIEKEKLFKKAKLIVLKAKQKQLDKEIKGIEEELRQYAM